MHPADYLIIVILYTGSVKLSGRTAARELRGYERVIHPHSRGKSVQYDTHSGAVTFAEYRQYDACADGILHVSQNEPATFSLSQRVPSSVSMLRPSRVSMLPSSST